MPGKNGHGKGTIAWLSSDPQELRWELLQKAMDRRRSHWVDLGPRVGLRKLVPELPFAEMNICYFQPVGCKGKLSLLELIIFFPGDVSKWRPVVPQVSTRSCLVHLGPGFPSGPIILQVNQLGPPARCPFSPVSFLREGSPSEIDCRKKGILILTSLLGDLVKLEFLVRS